MAKLPLTPEQRSSLDAQQRRSVLGGLARSIAEKGYAETTVGDVVSAGRISKTTFYSHFADKEEALLALFGTTTDNVLTVIEQRASETEDLPWQERLATVIRAYFEALAADPALARCLLVEIQAVSPRCFALYRQAMDRYVALILHLGREVSERESGLRPLTPDLVLAVVAGINELMLRQIADRGTERLDEITPAAVALATAALTRDTA
jgi:AcrR family transcriptional regulator